MVAAVKGYKQVLLMPESMSVERRRLMQAYGATFNPTPREGGMKAAIARATELAEQTPSSWIPQQFEAREWARQSAAKGGLLVGISSGATLAAIAKKLPELPSGAIVLGFNYDTGERYLSVPDCLRAS